MFIGFPRSVDKTKICNFKNSKNLFCNMVFLCHVRVSISSFYDNLKIFVFFEKKVGRTNFLDVFFHTERFRSTQSMLWRIEQYAMYQVFMQILRYLCHIWLIVRWGPSSPPALSLLSLSRIWPYLPPLYRPRTSGFCQNNLKILKDKKVLTFG